MPRHGFDGDRLDKDVARLAAADKASSPAARPSLMDAVRELAPFIETPARLNWGDPKIAAVLSAAGYPIDAATLRSYRKRLRDEGLPPPLKGETRKQPIPAPAPHPGPQLPDPLAAQPLTRTAPPSSDVGVIDAASSVAQPIMDGAMSRAPPGIASAPKPTPWRFEALGRVATMRDEIETVAIGAELRLDTMLDRQRRLIETVMQEHTDRMGASAQSFATTIGEIKLLREMLEANVRYAQAIVRVLAELKSEESGSSMRDLFQARLDKALAAQVPAFDQVFRTLLLDTIHRGMGRYMLIVQGELLGIAVAVLGSVLNQLAGARLD